MDPVIIGVFVVGVIVTMVFPPLLINQSSNRRRFAQMDSPKLIASNLHAGTMKGKFRLVAYILPLPALILARSFLEQERQTVVISIVFIVIFSCLSAAQFFGEIEKLTAAEMDNRRSAKDRNDPAGGKR